MGAGVHCIEFKRRAVTSQDVEHKLGPYGRMAPPGHPVPLLLVYETARGRCPC